MNVRLMWNYFDFLKFIPTVYDTKIRPTSYYEQPKRIYVSDLLSFNV